MSTAKKKSGTGSGQSGSAKSPNNDNRVVASNRRARHDYDLIETFECGIVLQNFQDLHEGDVLETYETRLQERELSS